MGEKSPKDETVFWKLNILWQIFFFFNLKKIGLNATEKLFFWGACHHIYAYWLQFLNTLELMSAVKLNSAPLGMLSPPWLHQKFYFKNINTFFKKN